MSEDVTLDYLDELAELQAQPVQPVQPVSPVPQRGAGAAGRALNNTRAWFGRFVSTVQDSDLDLLTLWAAHTHLAVETYSTPRLLIDSPVPGSGKTTTLEHLERLCLNPVQMATVSSPAMIVRLLDAGLRTILIDEADRSLSPDKEGIGDLIAVLNSGYKRGATRPVSVPSKEGGWRVAEMSTFSPVAMAGNQPNLPEDTRSRSLRVLLMPDNENQIEESDWEWIEDEARGIGKQLAAWADTVRDEVRTTRPTLPEKVRGRARERWAPLMRVAVAAGGRWPALVERLSVEDVEEQEIAREEGAVSQKPHVVLLQHVAEVWPPGQTFVTAEELIDALVAEHPDMWGDFSTYGKRLTPQRMGRMLSNYRVLTSRPGGRERGYTAATLATPLRRFGLALPGEPAKPATTAEPARCAGCHEPMRDLGDGATTHPSCEAVA
ncbi:DUF3631 domain-containing protein [Nocardioidaceae bacterium]|nr:DUF3631 domain-containing protein [Nocardioidaceae bacterium]